ncbi:hypothetical protein JKF63_07520 [Porcisia hertigi]|uniref:Rnh202 triple barrel domain-containing protein n=1 Tax=Porcisia hertigi TaxID=2761500 RepID=A0A836IZ03_9TRYP|nr:hypothetical protein JKF63_07520 [Porcisia hertigi]
MSQPQHSDDKGHARAEEGIAGTTLSLTCDGPSKVFPACLAEGEADPNCVTQRVDVDGTDGDNRGGYTVDDRDDSSDDDGGHTRYASASSSRFYAHITASSKDDACSFRSPNHPHPPVRHDPHDRTAAEPMQAASSSSSGKVQRRRVWILPRDAFPPQCLASLSTTTKVCGDSGLYVSNGCSSTCESTRTSTQSTAAATTFATTGHMDARLQPVSHLNSPAVKVAAPSALPCMLNASVVRLPHPRHGQPFLCIVVREPGISAVASTPSATPPSSASASSSLLYEVQSQAPPSVFAQSWFVQEQVVPSTVDDGGLLVATPLDLTFFALHELFSDAERYERLASTFMSAEDLYRDRDFSSSAPICVSAPDMGTAVPGVSAYMSVFGDVGGASEDSRSSSSSSRPTSVLFNAAHFLSASGDGASVNGGCPGDRAVGPVPWDSTTTLSALSHGKLSGGRRRGWNGWARATAEHPFLLHHCMGALQSDGVLRRLCEVRAVGSGTFSADTSPSSTPVEAPPSLYYKPSESVALDWLKRKIEHVRASAVLRALLQLPDSTSVAASTAAPTAAAEACTEVPMSFAFGVVAEYVPDRLHAALAVACGISDLAAQPVSSLTSAASLHDTQQPRRSGDLTTRRGSDVVPSAVGPKSASVRRLEKAGPPKGTPTLFDMFAKKKLKTESDAS